LTLLRILEITLPVLQFYTMDKLYRNVKTGETKPLPEKVYQAVRKYWEPVEQSESSEADPEITETIQVIEEDKKAASDPEIKENLDILQQIVSEEYADESEPEGEPDKEALQAEYEALKGEKPDGRWSVKRLSQEIEELKTGNK
jgi:hypothetical protein